MKKSRRTYNGVHLNKKSNTQDVVEQSLTVQIQEHKDEHHATEEGCACLNHVSGGYSGK